MLVLTRRPRQVVIIGRDIQIMVLDVGAGRVRLVSPRHANFESCDKYTTRTQERRAAYEIAPGSF
jgi:sRNA-binding carbon storage regulator CsrA